MEIWCKDEIAKDASKGKKAAIVALVHKNLGNASVVEMSSLDGGEQFRLETASGNFAVDKHFCRAEGEVNFA